MKLSVKHHRQSGPVPEGYVRTYRVYDEGGREMLSAVIVSSMGVMGKSGFAFGRESYTVSQVRAPGVPKYEFKSAGEIFGRLDGLTLVDTSGGTIAIAVDPSIAAKRLARNILHGDTEEFEIVSADRAEHIATWRRPSDKGSIFSLEAWKRALAQHSERDAAEMELYDTLTCGIDKRLLLGLAVLLHYITAGRNTG